MSTFKLNRSNMSKLASVPVIGNAEFMKKKKRITYKNIADSEFDLDDLPPTSVARRNERERNRVKMVNNGFATLRNHVPSGQKNKKMSKVETLRGAVDYIKKLQKLLNQTASGSGLSLPDLDTSSISDYDCQQQSFDSYDAPVSVSTSGGDENCYTTVSPTGHLPMMSQMIYSPANSTAYPGAYSNNAMLTGYLTSPVSLTSRTSPTPSMSSDITSESSSPYQNIDSLHLQQQQHQQNILVQNQHSHQQYSSQNGQQNILLDHSDHDSELYDLVNWFGN